MKSSKVTQEERLLAIKMWRESGLSQGVFCKQEGISRSTFQHWRRRLDPTYEKMPSRSKRKMKPEKVNSVFIPIEVTAKEHSSSEVATFEFQYPNGVKIICQEDLESAKLKILIQLF